MKWDVCWAKQRETDEGCALAICLKTDMGSGRLLTRVPVTMSDNLQTSCKG